jgi:hypothetical protein
MIDQDSLGRFIRTLAAWEGGISIAECLKADDLILQVVVNLTANRHLLIEPTTQLV